MDIPLGGLPPGEAARGVERLQHALGRATGLVSATLDEPAGMLRLRYDPRFVSLGRVQDLARRLGPGLARRFERCTLCVLGLRASGASPGGLVSRVEACPGVAGAAVCPVSGRLSVEFDPEHAEPDAIARRVAEAGYRAHPAPRDRASLRQAHDEDTRSRRLMVTLTILCLVLALSGWGVDHFGGPHAAAVACFVGAYLTGGFLSARQAWRELLVGTLNVDLLMVLAALGAAAVDAWAEGATLLFLFSLSNTLEQTILGRTRRAIEALMDLTPEEAVVLRDGREERVPVAELRVGDRILVRPGERIAADGLIQVGRTSVDQSAMTGESIPVDRTVGDGVFAATLNGPGAIEVEVSRVAGDTALSRIVRLVEEAQAEKAPSQRFTEWFGPRYTLAVLGLAGLTLAAAPFLLDEPFARSFYRAMTVLVVASPCAVVISIPAAILSAIAGAARGGILFKGGAHLERAASLRAVAFDKTGTLTLGKPKVVDVRTVESVGADELLRVAASAESLSEHPLSKAVVAAAADRGLTLEPSSDLEALIGRGLIARVGVDRRLVRIGRPVLFTEAGQEIPGALAAEVEKLSASGKTVVLVGDDRGVLGALAIADTLRPGAEAALRALKELAIEHLVMLTGDQAAVAQAIASGLGLEYESELLPEDKLRAIERLRQRYQSVAMVGDGINDAPALAASTLGVSLGGGGTDVALETADVVLMADDLGLLPEAIAQARSATRIIRQNLVFAFGMMALLLTATYFGTLPLPLAVLGHEGSTVLVILNGVRLLRSPRRRP
ncbi:MAG: heavy metal translocating P-type ATPase [Isosphaeraceae bacterium]